MKNAPAVTVRPADARDAESLRAIYNWAVAHTTATMATEPRTPEEQDAWLAEHDGVRYPALVAEAPDGTVVGYASLSPYIRRPGYDITAETSVYIHLDWHGRGVGTVLLSRLVDEADRREFVCLLALITADNEPSLRLHYRHGFTTVGTIRRVGCKFGVYVDVTTLQRLRPAAP